jgi:predicted RNase H-like HicB family nuclease
MRHVANDDPVSVAVTLTEAPGKGWVAHAADARAVAQGASTEEALDNLRSLVLTYPEVFEEVRAARTRHVEVVAAAPHLPDREPTEGTCG